MVEFVCELVSNCIASEWKIVCNFMFNITILRDLIAVYRGCVHFVRTVTRVDFVWLTMKQSNP